VCTARAEGDGGFVIWYLKVVSGVQWWCVEISLGVMYLFIYLWIYFFVLCHVV